MSEDVIILSTAIIGYFLLNRVKHSFVIYSILSMPGTILHELSHAISSFILNGKPVDINFFPKKVKEGDFIYYELGYVVSTNIRWYNAAIIGLAPLSIFCLGYYIYFSEINNVIKIVSLPLVLDAAIPSSSDFKIASKSIVPIMFFIGIFTFLYYNESNTVKIIWEKISEIYNIN